MDSTTCHHYVTYSGIKLPLKLVSPLEPADIANRNTYFRAWYDRALGVRSPIAHFIVPL